jgi:hypothetical protein
MVDHGPKTKCQRTKCAEIPEHLAGRHLNQRDELYDGPDLLLQVLPLAVRDSARRIVREAPALMPEVVDLGKHIQWLRDQKVHVQVDADRKVREAMARSEDCEHHGKEITQLSEQLDHFDKAHDRADAGRVAVLGLLFTVDELVRQHEAGQLPDLTVDGLVAALAQSARKTHAAHDRAWKR